MPLVEWDEAQFEEQYRTRTGFVTPDRQHLKLGYCRFIHIPNNRTRAIRLAQSLQLTGQESILFVGCAFGWLVECFILQGHEGNCVGIDSGSYIQSAKDKPELAEVARTVQRQGITPFHSDYVPLLEHFTDNGPKARVPVYDEDLLSDDSINRVLDLNQGVKYDIVLTERVLTSLTDREAVNLSKACNKVGEKVVHLVVPWIARKFDPENPEPNPWNRKWPNDTRQPTHPYFMKLPWYTSTSWKRLLRPDTIVESTGYRVF